MSVIIRLQNLPWSANALDIRQFFKGLSIPEGGVHIVGGEMGDAFIAFSTDEDARQAMMHDREKINEVQVRLLLSSRAEMQKVIETARQQSMLALKNATAVPAKLSTPLPTPQPPVITANSLQNILSNPLGPAPSFLAYQQQAGITLSDKPTEIPDKSVRRNSSDPIRERHRSNSHERRRSRSRERDRNDRSSSSRRRRERSSSRSRDRDYKGRRSSRRSRSRDQSHDRSRDRSRERSHEKSRNFNRSTHSNDKDNSVVNRTLRDNFNKANVPKTTEMDISKPKMPVMSPWTIPPMNAYKTTLVADSAVKTTPNPFVAGSAGAASLVNPFNAKLIAQTMPHQVTPNAYTTASVSFKGPEVTSAATVAGIIPAFQNYTSTAASTNNYSINLLGNSNSNSNDSVKPFALQNPYTTAIQAASNVNTNSQDSQSNTMFPGLFLDKKPELPEPKTNSVATPSFGQIQQEPIAFANTNPYAQMYPTLFAQAAAMGIAPKVQEVNPAPPKEEHQSEHNMQESCSIKISNMCSSTTYSDLRKFFAGLFIPHNGIKMVNDKHGLRIGTAYLQFSRISSVQKALVRNNSMLKSKTVKLEIVSDSDFDNAEDSFRPYHNRFDRTNYGSRNENENWGNTKEGNSFERVNPYQDVGPFNVLYIEDIPTMATELDIMKMFSSYTIYDILLTSSPENRREFISHVRFSREEEAKAALEDKSRHLIGYRKVRVRPGSIEEMDKAKEKLRLANEQLKKEEQALEAEEEAKQKEEDEMNRKLEEIDEEGMQDMDEDNDMQVIELDGNEEMDNDEKHNGEDGDEDDDIGELRDNQGRANRDPRNPNIPSIFDLSPPKPENMSSPIDGPSDPRLRRQQRSNRFESNRDQQPNNNNNNMGNNSMNNNNNNMNNNNPMMNNFNPNMNPNMPPNFSGNPMEENFIIMKNCDYKTCVDDVAELFMSSNLRLKHIEPLRNDRHLPTGEFIVEFQDNNNTERALNDFNNIQFRSRNLRIRSISPQEIADRIGKPFMNYFPGGGGRGNAPSHMQGGFDLPGRGGPNTMDFHGNNNNNMPNRFGGNNMQNRGGGAGNRNAGFGGEGSGSMRGVRRGGVGMNRGGMMNSNFNDNSQRNNSADHQVKDDDVVDLVDDDSRDTAECAPPPPPISNNGMPEKFTRPGCVLAMENVPYKAELKDILKFFGDFPLTPDDIIRRFNDDGTATGDARVAFETPTMARSAFETKKRKHMFSRTIYLKLL